MMISTALAAAVLAAPAIELENIGIDYKDVVPSQMRLPVGESVRALSWKVMRVKPEQPVTVRLACVVWRTGKIGNCVSASVVPPALTSVDWQRLRAADRTAFDAASPLERATRIAAEARVSVGLMPANEGAKPHQFTVRFFKETVSPSDERPPYSPSSQPSLSLSDVTLARPMDGDLVRDLYPALAIRHKAEGRISFRCRIEKSGSLLCLDPGAIAGETEKWGEERDAIVDEFQMASYQAASTLTVASKGKNGEPVVGRELELAIAWMLPR